MPTLKRQSVSRLSKDKKVLVTGATGFLGKHVVKELTGKCEIIAIGSNDYDLTKERGIRYLFVDHQPDIIIHLAAVCGGIGANQSEPGRFFYENLIMGARLIDYANGSVDKFVQIGTVCSYPKFTPVPFKEEDLWNGYPEETNAPYGIAKKALLVQLQAYRQQYGFNGIYLIPVNLYGPGDNFNLNTSHVIPAMVRKMVEARYNHDKQITLWGTGTASREFLYVEDAAKLIVKATDLYEGGDPVNLGTGQSIEIYALANLIAKLTGFEGEIIWDHSKPNGQPKRQLRVHPEYTGTTSFEEGLKKTVEYYENSRRSILMPSV